MFWWAHEKWESDASNSTICKGFHRRILDHLGLWRAPMWQTSWKAPMGPPHNICIRRLKMAVVAIVHLHLHLVDVGFMLRSSGWTSESNPAPFGSKAEVKSVSNWGVESSWEERRRHSSSVRCSTLVRAPSPMFHTFVWNIRGRNVNLALAFPSCKKN
jgi:hypothetical protein